ncbi:SGNH/GDSL hydrolase family protein [Kocuria sp. CPCC 205300]|uniref:SGNH/GDSL hydrolase family protein n=1 Tax=Kocuria sabuli TaxID=3071448 RepID=UPI0036DC46F9
MLFRYAGVIAINPNTEQTEIVKSATGTVHLDENWETPVEVHDVNGFAMTTLNTTVEGLFPDFYVEDQPVVGFQTSSGHRFYLRSSTPVPGPSGPAPVSIGASGGALTFEYPDGTIIGGPLIPTPEALGDVKIAELLESASSASSAAVQSRVSAAVAADTTVATAAAAAVDTEIAGRDLLEGSTIVESDIAFAVVDGGGRRSWIEIGPDGRPTSYAARLLGQSEPLIGSVGAGLGMESVSGAVTDLSYAVVDQNGRRTELELDAAGKITARVLSAWASRIGTVAGTGTDFPINDWAAWGDSFTGTSWPGLLATSLGVSVYNGGRGGQKTAEIAARQGGTPARVTLNGNTIPSSGPVTVTTITSSPLSAGDSRPGRVAGVLGTLARSADGATTTFTRSADGTAVAVTAGSRFIPEDGATRRDRITTIWVGRNDLRPESEGPNASTPLDRILPRVQSMIDYLTPAVRRVMVLEIAPRDDETPGTAARTRLDDYNAALKAAFPQHFVPIATWLRTTAAATAAGITFTTDDQADIANGITPRSLRSDVLHLNEAGNTAVVSRLTTEAQNRGWI